MDTSRHIQVSQTRRSAFLWTPVVVFTGHFCIQEALSTCLYAVAQCFGLPCSMYRWALHSSASSQPSRSLHVESPPSLRCGLCFSPLALLTVPSFREPSSAVLRSIVEHLLYAKRWEGAIVWGEGPSSESPRFKCVSSVLGEQLPNLTETVTNSLKCGESGPFSFFLVIDKVVDVKHPSWMFVCKSDLVNVGAELWCSGHVLSP